jgi:hypothetical protein
MMRSGSSWLLWGSLWLAASLGCPEALRAEQAAMVRQEVDSRLATQVKAAYLYNFLVFTDWQDLHPEKQQLRLAVLGDPELAGMLAELHETKVSGMTISIAGLDALPEDGPLPHLLYVCGTAADGVDVFSWAAARPVLLVSDQIGFLDAGGHIQLVYVAEHIRFSVNLPAARAAGLQFRSRMLRLAVEVRQ